MPVAIPPVLVLALLLILLGTQVAYILVPRAPHYLVRLGLSTLAVLLGEAASLLGAPGRPALGELHPVIDLALIAIVQWTVTRFLRRQPV